MFDAKLGNPPIRKKTVARVFTLIKSFVSPKDSISRISIEQYNREIAEAMDEVKSGNYITQEDLEKESSLW